MSRPPELLRPWHIGHSGPGRAGSCGAYPESLILLIVKEYCLHHKYEATENLRYITQIRGYKKPLQHP